MINIIYEISLILSVILFFLMFNKIIKSKKKYNISIIKFIIIQSIIMLAMYLLLHWFNIFNLGGMAIFYSKHSNICIDIVLFIFIIFIYRYVYDIGYFSLAGIFVFINIYYNLIKNMVIYRFIFFLITGYSFSSKYYYSISKAENTKIELYSVLLAFLIFIMILVLIKIINKILKRKKVYVYLIYLFSLNGIILAINKMAYMMEKNDKLFSDIFIINNVIIPKFLIVNSICIVLISIVMIRNERKSMKEELLNNKLKLQENYYNELKNSQNEIKKLYHDINNHITNIENLVDNKESKKYVENLKSEFKGSKMVESSGNAIVDIIINEKTKTCREKDINFKKVVDSSEIGFMKQVDISNIFTNMLENAIEACEKIKDVDIEKYILLKAYKVKSYYIISCKNSKENQINLKNNHYITDKANKFLHGLGIKSIKSSTKKYKGDIKINHGESEFELKIIIPLQ
ncbi:ATP-binding protein [Peptostreptococcus faecalis]|uniref:ATP-binding protein n=1 Tax=Peptostreptococcus faecalis TaxID=2045015 RepID=UPI000C7C0F40|nr:ATP-binding protein [Peptostreptococcus faecalis]